MKHEKIVKKTIWYNCLIIKVWLDAATAAPESLHTPGWGHSHSPRCRVDIYNCDIHIGCDIIAKYFLH